MNQKFLKKIIFLQKYYGYHLDDETLSMYDKMLSKYTDEEVSFMISKVVESFIPTSQVPFPMIPNFLQSVGLSGKLRIQHAISAVKESQKLGPYKSISFGDRAIHSTINDFGGWEIICNWSPDDWQFNEKRFSAAYEAHIISGNGPDYLIGIYESTNLENIHRYNERQKSIAIKSSEIVKINWIGFDRSIKLPEFGLNLIEEKKEDVFQIECNVKSI